ncbi:MAG: class I SAM-dependent methyltransferase [Candidatus Sedimenticola sp. (ex Thyasira tokunagai)]
MKESPYSEKDWNDYAQPHQSIMTSAMYELNQAVASQMKGRVIDLGCGTAKVAPFVLEEAAVTNYTGIDSSSKMVDHARRMLEKFSYKPSKVFCVKIEDFTSSQNFDSALSINSYYAWTDPLRVLSHIRSLLNEGGVFILATPNKKIDMPKLLRASDKEIINHPFYQDFRKMNLDFCNNDGALFVDMNELITQVQSVGFQVSEAHQRFYLGGLNFITMTK